MLFYTWNEDERFLQNMAKFLADYCATF